MQTLGFASSLDLRYPVAFAHRGGNEHYPENTLEAFQDAYRTGYRYFETDVHYTAGNELVAFHDTNMQRTLGLQGSIDKMTKKERQMLRINGKYTVPLLSELLTVFPDVYFSIDAKSPQTVEPLVSVIKALKAESRVCLASFSAVSLKYLRILLPEVSTTATRREILRLRYSGRASDLQLKSRYLAIPHYILYNHRRLPFVNATSIARFHHHGCKVFVWTVNEVTEMQQLLDMGVDGLFTDKLSVLKEVLQVRKQWIKS